MNRKTIKKIERIPEVLKRIKFDKLRDCQAVPIQRTLQEKDQFVVLPTGGGKTACYIVPTLCADYKTIIFSPLVALMKDQLRGLLRMNLKAGAIHSKQENSENERALREWNAGELDFLLISPERTENEAFLTTVRTNPPDMVVVDEIHVASEHAFNFRPAFRKIAPLVHELNPKVFLGLTATMPENVEKDLRIIFDARDAVRTVTYYKRENLKLRGEVWKSPFDLLRRINNIKGSVIVYFSTVRQVEETYEILKDKIRGNACIYHGRLGKGVRSTNQDMFMDGTIRVVFATNSFGMGVDKPDIRGILFGTVPGSVEELSQGFGRGGRDGKDCECVLLWNEQSIETQKFFIETGHPDRSAITSFFRVVQSRSNSEGICDLKLGEICHQARLNPMYSEAIMAILSGEGVLKRVKLDKPLRVKLLDEAKTKATQSVIDKIMELGVRNENDGFYEIDKEFLVEQLGKNEATVNKHLGDLTKQKCIEMQDPSRYNPLQVVKGLNDIDFEKVTKRRNAAYKRLQQVRDFWECPDSKKHDFLNEYFKSENRTA